MFYDIPNENDIDVDDYSNLDKSANSRLGKTAGANARMKAGESMNIGAKDNSFNLQSQEDWSFVPNENR